MKLLISLPNCTQYLYPLRTTPTEYFHGHELRTTGAYTLSVMDNYAASQLLDYLSVNELIVYAQIDGGVTSGDVEDLFNWAIVDDCIELADNPFSGRAVTFDGYRFTQQADGAWSDGDMTWPTTQALIDACEGELIFE